MRFWLWLALFIPVQGIGQLTYAQAEKSIHQIIRHDLRLPLNHSPIILGLIDHDSVVILNINGPLNKVSNLNDTTWFPLAGLTEVFVAENLYSALREGFVHLTDTIFELPTVGGPSFPLTLDKLFFHRSGLPRILAKEPTANQNIENTFWDILAYQKLINPGQWNYSPLNHVVIQRYLNLKCGKNCDEAWTSPYARAGKDILHAVSPMYTDPEETLSIFSNVNLLLGYLQNKMKSEIVISQSVPTNTAGLSFGEGWYIHSLRGGLKAYTHAGHSLHHKVFLGFAPHTFTGVVLYSPDPLATRDLGWLALRWLNQQWKRKK